MSSLKVGCILLCSFLINVKNAVSVPKDLSSRYQNGNLIEQSDWRLILSSIESRLRNLDNLYTSQLTPTLETRLEHFQNRISGMEIKLLRIEALLTTKLDRMSDNISSRHFRDDMVQTDMFRKIESAYDGITHRLSYMDRKSENGFLKLQEKSEAISKKIETSKDSLTDKYDSIESQLTDLIEGMEDIGVSLHNSGNKPVKTIEQHTNVSPNRASHKRQNEMQDTLRNNHPQDFAKEMSAICENSSKNLEFLKQEFNNFTRNNSTEKYLKTFADDIGRILNDYASKVSDLGAQVTKSDNKIATHLSIIEAVVNSSKVEMQNGLRTLMVQVGKISPKDNLRYEVTDQKLLSDVAQKLDDNFEKVISTQNTFLESCHRLQMDESQLEDQISDILNKLIDNFEGTTREHHNVLRKIEGILVKHDMHTKRELHKANVNTMTIYENSKNESKETEEQFKQITNNLEALLALVQNILGNSNGISKRGLSEEKELIEYIQSLERALNFTKLQQMEMFESYKATVETLMTLSQTKREDEHSSVSLMNNLTNSMTLLRQYLGNLSKNLDTNITTDILNSVHKTFELVTKNSENLRKISQSTFLHNENKNDSKLREEIIPVKNDSVHINATKLNDNSDLDSLIREIFFTNDSVPIESSSTQNPCLDVNIDVRFQNGDNFNNEGSTKKCPKDVSKDNIIFASDNIIFPNEEPINDNTDRLDISIDSKSDTFPPNNDNSRPCGDTKSENQKDLNNPEKQNMKSTITYNITDDSQLIQKIIPFLNINEQ